MVAEILHFPAVAPLRLERLAQNLWMLRLSDTPEAAAAADRLVEQLRAHNMIVPDYLRGE